VGIGGGGGWRAVQELALQAGNEERDGLKGGEHDDEGNDAGTAAP
jgi:hypothetical protein